LEFSQAAREVNGNHGNFGWACDGEVSDTNVEHYREKRGERQEDGESKAAHKLHKLPIFNFLKGDRTGTGLAGDEGEEAAYGMAQNLIDFEEAVRLGCDLLQSCIRRRARSAHTQSA
jgi:hypothetical protein